ncbi:MAG: DUF1338 family protein [Planctomycetota bacterium]
MAEAFVDKIQMQNRLFAELSRMFGQEVPLYDKSLLCNLVCNRAVCELIGQRFPGFSITDEQIDLTSGERHGAIRIGKPEEYRWVGRFFAAFAMHPHNFYDMTALGGKSQPVIATAFRSKHNPEHRVFSSLLMTNYFDDSTRDRVESLLAGRQVFSDRAKELIEKDERQGGLDAEDAKALIAEATNRIFKWTGEARGHALYTDLCAGGFKIAADVACFESHHLNHLTPNTFCMDLYTSAMKLCLGELDRETFQARATDALTWIAEHADRDYLVLHFKHMDRQAIDALPEATPPTAAVPGQVAALAERLSQPDLDLSQLNHNGFKDYTEGPATETQVLLRQDAYKALTEPVTFTDGDARVETEHTARFGEIEQRFYATTPKGRALYDQSLAEHEKNRAEHPDLAKTDHSAYAAMQAEAFRAFPKTLDGLLEQQLIYGKYTPTPAGLDAAGTLASADLRELVAAGHVQADGLRYEDFLPFSAAGIFASNLNQYGTASTAAQKPDYTPELLEDILGQPIIDVDTQYRAIEAVSLLDTYERLGLGDQLSAEHKRELEAAAGLDNAPAALA